MMVILLHITVMREVTDMICLDEKYSTTRLLMKVKPLIENNLEDKFESVLFLPECEDRKEEGGLRTKGYFKKSYDEKSLISIVTVVYNGEQFLEETILSVINQSYDNVEYIIIDGGSTDGTVDIIKKHEDKIDYWVSESDNGIYDAMNKGIRQCSGEIIGIVNADDFIYDNTLKMVNSVLTDKLYKYTYGSVNVVNEYGEIIGEKLSKNKLQLQKSLYYGMPFPHPSVFVKKEIYTDIIGLYDTSFKLSADFDFLLKLIECKIKGVKINKPLAAFRIGGQSGGLKTFLENIKVLKKRKISIMKIYSLTVKSLISITLTKYLPNSFVVFFKSFKSNSLNKVYR